jgi:capsular exopolysaccharide synthesis family protein
VLVLAAFLREAIVDGVDERLVVEPASSTNVIAIRFASADPALAARVANELARLYIEDTLEEKRAAANRVRSFLEVEITRLRESLLRSEEAVQEYRRQAGLVSTNSGPLDTQQLAQLSTELVLVRSQRAAAEARAAALRGLLAGGNNAEAAAQFSQSPTLLDLQTRELDVKRRMAEASNQYGERHPTMVALRAEAEELANRKELEARNLLQGLLNEARAIRSREAALEASLEQSKGQVARLDDAGVQLRSLEREAAASRQLLETYLARQSEIRSQEKAQEPDARVISPAVAPDAPVSPRRMTILALSLLGGLFLGSVGALSLEQLDQTVRSGDQLEGMFGVKPIGLIPLLDERRLSDDRVAAYALDRPRSRLGEAIRALRAAVVANASDAGPMVLLITSALPGEAKSTVAVALARLHAQSGAKTLLIDADLRRPRLDMLLEGGERPGLSDILSGREVDAGSAVHRDSRSGLELLAAGRAGTDPTILLGSAALRRLLAGLRLRYDLIVIDSPPLIGVSDARLLAPLADATLFLVRWGATQRQDVGAALRMLREARATLIGAALTLVDVRRHAAYGYSDSGHYYYDRYTKYYEA